MNKNFDTVASNILQESIKSAIFIDDSVRLPFEKKSENPNVIDFSDMIPPFEKKGCTLSFYRFDQEWTKKVSYLFDNRDLLILDWQLKKYQDTYTDTLSILQEAVNTDSLHFCCIYTDTNPNDFVNRIIFPVLFYFGYCVRLNKRELFAINSNFQKQCDIEGLDSEEVISELNPHLREFLIYSSEPSKKTKIIKKILDYLRENFSDFNQIRSHIRQITGDLGQSFVALAYSFENQIIPICENLYNVRLKNTDTGNWRLYVNNTLITIANKEAIKEQTFYEEFKNSIVEEHNIFLTLLGLEMRNSFRRGSGFIGKELDEISETAFFFHHRSIKPKAAFYEFLRELWVDQATQFLHSDKPLLYSTIEEYMEISNMDNKVNEFENKFATEKNFQQDLVKLNNFFNQLKFSPNENELLSFGDVLKFKKEDDSLVYLICVTPLCDCVEPTKINNQYFFVKNEYLIENIVTAIEKAEGKYISYIRDEKNIVCIDWHECKPFSLYIKDPRLHTMSKVSYLNKWISLIHVGRIKENFAQRIANKALGYSSRVGVSLAQIS